MNRRFGEILREQRQAKRRTLGDLARALGVSVAFVSDVELSRRPPLTRERIERAATFLDLDPSELHLAAASYKGSVELATDSPVRQHTAAALARGWSEYNETQLHLLQAFLEDLRKDKDE